MLTTLLVNRLLVNIANTKIWVHLTFVLVHLRKKIRRTSAKSTAERSLCKVLSRLGVTGVAKKRAIQSASEAVEKATRWLWIKRADPWTATGT